MRMQGQRPAAPGKFCAADTLYYPYRCILTRGGRNTPFGSSSKPRDSFTAKSGEQTPVSAGFDESTQPWKFGFQMNERYLKWDEAAHAQLLKMACASKLNLSVKEVEQRVVEVAALIPDLATRMGTMKRDILVALLEDTERLAERLSQLRTMMPETNLSKLISCSPGLVLDYETEDLARRLDNLRHSFGDRTDVEFLIAREPNLLRLAKSREAVDSLIADVERLLPVKDAVGFVINNPGLVLDMDASNLPSAIDGDLTQEDPSS